MHTGTTGLAALKGAHGTKMLPLAFTAACVLFAAVPAPAQDAAAPPPPATQPAKAPSDLSLEQLFADYLHFVRMGAVREAEAFAAALMNRKPAATDLLQLADKYRNSRETLQTAIAGGSMANGAMQVLELIRAGEVERRKSADQITGAIAMLSGTPVQRTVGIERLRHAGEYAIPWMIATLSDAGKKDLHPFIERSLAAIGKPAVNPLVVALRSPRDAVCQSVMDALGELGYPQALPYLRRIATAPDRTEAVRNTAASAIARILARNPGTADLPPAEAFLALAEQYYADTPSLRPDPREELANVWYYRDDAVKPIAVPRRIFMEVMCMRSCESAIAMQPTTPMAVSLWSAANFRREAKLGMNVQSVDADPKALADATRPEGYPRSLYFARCFGARAALLTLARGIQDRDTAVTLGAATALDGIASANDLLGSEEARQATIQALRFPDLRTRITVALGLARSRPPAAFPGATEVVPVLASALDLRSRSVVLIADPDANSRRVLEELAGRAGATTIATPGVAEAMSRARAEATHIDLVVLATDAQDPDVPAALALLRKDPALELAPIMLAVKPGGTGVAIKAFEADPRVERLSLARTTDLNDEAVAALQAAFMDGWARGRAGRGLLPFSDEEALWLSLSAAEALRLIAVSGTSIFQFAAAEPALIRACSHPVEEMRIRAAAALAWSPTPAAQTAIATLALGPEGSDAQRITGMAILAESAKRFGKRLPTDVAVTIAKVAMHEASLPIRTAASQALGALNTEPDLAIEILRTQSGN